MTNPYQLVQCVVPPYAGQGRPAFNKTVYQCSRCETQHWYITVSGTAVCCNCHAAIIVRVIS